MAQKGGSNWLWWTIGSISLIGVGAGAFFYFRKKRKDAELASALNQPQPQQPIIQTVIQGAKEVIQGVPVPFKTDAEGNAFRAWVNDKYPDYAKSIQLDRTGKRDNSFIKKAWDKYGAEYLTTDEGKGQVTLIKAGGFDKIANQMREANLKSEFVRADKIRFYILDRWGINDIMANFTPNGMFWIEDEGDASKKYGGTWGYNNDMYTIKLNDGSWNMSDSDISDMVKQIAKMKFPSDTTDLNFSGFVGADGLDKMLNKKSKNYVDSQDAML